MDRKEQFLSELNLAMAQSHIQPEDCQILKNKIISILGKYDLVDRTKDIAVADQSSERFVQLYAGTLATEGKSCNTVKLYTDILHRFHRFVNKPLTEINVFDIRIWLANLQQSVSLRTCENYRSYIASFYTWMAAEEFISKNPMVKIKPIKYDEGTRKPFSDVEIDKMRSACTTLRERAIIEMLLSCGARVSELSALNISDVDIRTKTVHIKSGKGNKSRITYISDVCLEHLQDYLQSRTDQDPALFYTKFRSRMKKASIEAELKKIGNRAGVANVHPHRCRRTFATNLAKKGMDIASIQVLMGHTDINTTRMYISYTQDRLSQEYSRYA